jgi:hypothetical protein
MIFDISASALQFFWNARRGEERAEAIMAGSFLLLHRSSQDHPIHFSRSPSN